MMLDQDADEALERAEDRAVEHQRMMLLAVLADVDRAQPLGHLRVELVACRTARCGRSRPVRWNSSLGP